VIGRVGVVHGEDSEGFSVLPVCLISMLLPAFALATVLLAFLLSCFLAFLLSCFLACSATRPATDGWLLSRSLLMREEHTRPPCRTPTH